MGCGRFGLVTHGETESKGTRMLCCGGTSLFKACKHSLWCPTPAPATRSGTVRVRGDRLVGHPPGRNQQALELPSGTISSFEHAGAAGRISAGSRARTRDLRESGFTSILWRQQIDAGGRSVEPGPSRHSAGCAKPFGTDQERAITSRVECWRMLYESAAQPN